MNRIFYFSLLFCLYTLNGNSQACLPDSTYKDSTAPIYPRPLTPDFPGGGIDKIACINKPYSFVFTFNIPDSIKVPQLANPVPLDRVSIATTNAITNLPQSISYACNPPNCVFEKNTLGCLILSGTPDNSNTPGDFKPIITLRISALGGFVVQDIMYPGTLFPGEYILKLVSEANCTSKNNDVNGQKHTWYPNPSYGSIYIDGQQVDWVEIVDLQVRKIQTNINTNSIVLPQNITPGLYILRWKSGDSVLSQKIEIK